MSFFSQLATVIDFNVQSYLKNSSRNYLKVIEVSSGTFASRMVCKRSQFLTLYEPTRGSSTYELVMNSPTSAKDKVYSLCRSDRFTTDLHLNISKQILPLILQISPELCSLPRLQELWTLITSNPNWSAVHVAAHFGIQEALENATMLELASYKEQSTGMTPALVAAKQGRVEFIKAMTSSARNISFQDLDAQGNSLYHYAAQSNRETVEAVSLCKIGNLINSLNNDRQSPLNLACAADKPECVRALLSAGANPNRDGRKGLDSNIMSFIASQSTACAKEILSAFPNELHKTEAGNGGTLLHWAETKELIEILVELGCRVDSRNSNEETALHVMVQHDRFDCSLALLLAGADANLVDSDGNSPLHLAAKSGQVATIQALVAFGADANLVNHKGETARHIAQRRRKQARSAVHVIHSVGGKRCAKDSPKCSDSCSPFGKDDGDVPKVGLIARSRCLFDDMLDELCSNPTQENRGGDRILCLDGGGIRGLVLIQLLQALEAHLDGPIIEYFDWVAGTSTGGILSLLLASGKSVNYCKALYFKLKNQVFVGKKPYDEKILEQLLRREFGGRCMADLAGGPKVMVTATAAGTIPPDLHLFRTYTAPQDLLRLPGTSEQKKPEQQLIWEAARASGAAPTYFRAFGSYLDGGLMPNNPTMDALTEIQEYNAVLSALGSGHKVSKRSVVVSLGTGAKPIEKVVALDLSRPESFSLVETARLAFGVSNLGKLLVEWATCTDGRVVAQARARCSMAGTAYFRLSPSFTLDVALDCNDDLLLVQMLWETRAYVHSREAEFKKIAQLLKREIC